LRSFEPAKTFLDVVTPNALIEDMFMIATIRKIRIARTLIAVLFAEVWNDEMMLKSKNCTDTVLRKKNE